MSVEKSKKTDLLDLDMEVLQDEYSSTIENELLSYKMKEGIKIIFTGFDEYKNARQIIESESKNIDTKVEIQPSTFMSKFSGIYTYINTHVYIYIFIYI
jgi:hypothetical protein